MSDPLERLGIPIVPIEPRPEFAEALLRRIRGEVSVPGPRAATVRYFVGDVETATAFYRDLLGFEEDLRPSPLFAMLHRGELRLMLSVPGEAHALPGGASPQPGGHNRIALRVEDLTGTVEGLRGRGVRFRTDITAGVAVRTVLLEDPAGNPVELFEPRTARHEQETRPQSHRDVSQTPTEEAPE